MSKQGSAELTATLLGIYKWVFSLFLLAIGAGVSAYYITDPDPTVQQIGGVLIVVTLVASATAWLIMSWFHHMLWTNLSRSAPPAEPWSSQPVTFAGSPGAGVSWEGPTASGSTSAPSRTA